MNNQPKTLKVVELKSGKLFQIIDNDGSTVLYEYFDDCAIKDISGILTCRYFLFEKYGWPTNETK